MGTQSVPSPSDSGCSLAVVIIGRNEGERLTRSLGSVRAMQQPEGGVEIIYVDTASRDDSAGAMERAGVRTIRLRPPHPTAALARETGWRASSAAYILFLDGDSQIEPEFVVRTLPKFADPTVAVVWGRLREAHPEASLYNRIMHVQWLCLRSLPEGPTFHGTGIALVRRSALEASGGFNPRLTAGENTDLGRRMQQKGYVVLHAAIPMVRHDAEMLRLAEYWRRCYRDGYSFARLADTHRNSGQPLFHFEFSPAGGVLMSAGILGTIAASAALRSWIPAAAFCGVLLLLVVRLALRYRERASTTTEALLFSAHWHFKLIPNLYGHLLYRYDKLRGRERGLMEYRRA